jgi:hypothetical protein
MPDEKLPLIFHPGSGLALVKPQGGRILEEMVSGVLALSRTAEGANPALIPRFKIGGQELCEPDYLQVLLWAKALQLEPETVIERMLAIPEDEWLMKYKTQFVDGRIIKLWCDINLLPLESFEWVSNLVIESIYFFVPTECHSSARVLSLPLPTLLELECSYMELEELDLSKASSLQVLSCSNNQLTSLDLSAIPQLWYFDCDNNRLTSLGLASVPKMTHLQCNFNQIRVLDISAVIRLVNLSCIGNKLTSFVIPYASPVSSVCCGRNQLEWIDLSAAFNLRHLSCYDNQITTLDFSIAHQLNTLICWNNPIEEIDIRPLQYLEVLQLSEPLLTKRPQIMTFDEVMPHVIQRHDQNF